MIVLLTQQDNLLSLFTDDPETQKELMPLLDLFPILLCLDGYMTLQGAFIRSLNLQKEVTVLTLLAFYGIGIPFGLGLGYGASDLGVYGILVGLAISTFVLDVVIDLMVECTDWHQCAQEMQQ